jgi:drug/metabolite transporter (DMT)-like permease
MSTDTPQLRFGLLALILGNICLTFGPMFVRMADTGPVAAAFWRVTLAVPFLFLIAEFSKDRFQVPPRRLLLILAGAGMYFAIDLGLWHIGILQTKLANANLLANSTSFLLPLWVFISVRQQPTSTQGTALLLAVVGTALLMGRSYELSSQNLVGDILCFLAGVFYTGYLVLMMRARESLGQWSSLAWATAMSSLPLLLAAMAMGEAIIPKNWTPLLLLALFSQIFGQGLMIYAIGRVPPILFGMMLLLQPLLSAVLGWYQYDEVFVVQDLLGALFIATAIVIVRKPAQLPVKSSA